jgi:hypothetical protein
VIRTSEAAEYFGFCIFSYISTLIFCSFTLFFFGQNKFTLEDEFISKLTNGMNINLGETEEPQSINPVMI